MSSVDADQTTQNTGSDQPTLFAPVQQQVLKWIFFSYLRTSMVNVLKCRTPYTILFFA